MKALPSPRRLLFAFLVLVASSVAGQPKITLLSPTSGPVGATVTITGTGFDAVPANNIVYFGGVRALVTNASSASLTVTVPAGASNKPVSVLNMMTHLTAYSPLPFSPTFANPFNTGIPANFYNLPVPLGIISNPYALDMADMDGDGKPDIVFSTYYGLSVLHNTSAPGVVNTGSFAPVVNFAVSTSPQSFAINDIDGDGKLDLVVTDYLGYNNTNIVSILRNTSTPGSITATSFANKVSFVTAHAPTKVLVGDVDGDGKPDLIVNNSDGDVISLFRNTSTPGSITASSFAPRVDIVSGASSRSLAFGDVDGDGKPDIVSSQNYSGVGVLRNISIAGDISKASFQPWVGIAIQYDPAESQFEFTIQSVQLQDVDGDGKLDLISSSNTKSSIKRNTSTPGTITGSSFGPQVNFLSREGSIIPSLSDVDGDGKPDIVSGSRYIQDSIAPLSVFRNMSTPGSITSSSFENRITFLSYYSPVRFISVGDIDGDGLAEVILSSKSDINPGLDNISILKINASKSELVSPVSIISFSPTSGPAGTTVTITGTNFNTIPANNTVYFGAVKATVVGSSTSSITVTVPAGATNQPVSVLNNDAGISAYSSLPFITTFSNPFGPGSVPPDFYKPKIDFTTGALPFFVTLCDFNGDNKPDMLVANENANTISYVANTATGYISPYSFNRRDIPVGSHPRSIAVGDLNGNGTPDFVVANSASGNITVVSDFSSITLSVGGNPFSVAIGDLDGDGKPDIVAANLSSGTVSVLRNKSRIGSIYQSSFASPVLFPAGNSPRFVAVSDVDGDGKADIVVANERSNTVSVLRNTAVAGNIDAGSFAPIVSFATGDSPGGLLISDIDGDGMKDLVTCNFGSNTVSVLRNTAVAGTIDVASFAAKVDYATGEHPFSVATAQVDGDGKSDLVVANSSSGTLSVLLNRAAAGTIDGTSFDAKVDFATGGYPTCVTIGDLDRDGIPELVAANAATTSLSVLSASLLQVPVITSVSPYRSPAGSTVTLTGDNFNLTSAGNTVYFGAVKANITSASTTSLTVTVPTGATYQPVSVLDNAKGLTGYSSQPFIATFANPFGTGIPANFYRPKVDFAAGSLPFYTAIADLDGDGKPDMVVANAGSGTVSVLRNVSSTGSTNAASFAPKVDFATAADPRALVISDLDGDGKLDIAVAGSSSYIISVLRNTSTPGFLTTASFAPKVDIPTSGYISSIAAGDLDNDGKTDLVVTNSYTASVSILRNVSAPGNINASSFAAGVNFTTGYYNYPRFVALSDLDGDSRLDMAVANEQSNNISVWRNITLGTPGTFSFSEKVDFSVGAKPACVAAGDVDGDGKSDLLVVNYASGTISVLRNTSTTGNISAASFATPVNFTTGSNPFFVALGDADGDGKPDILVANANPNTGSVTNTISVLRNTASAGIVDQSSFAGKVDFVTGGYPDCISLGDLDGDGLAELATANAANGAISVFKINSPTPEEAATTTLLGTQAAGELSRKGMQLYPNPTKESFTLLLVGAKAQAASVEVLRENGIVIERRAINRSGHATTLTLQFSLRSQPTGIYYVKVTGADGIQVAKVVRR